MGTVPFALSVHSFVSSVGADAGFASIIGLAILALLYFAQARETATLRERLTESDARVGGLEQRLAALARAQPGAASTAAAVGAVGAQPAGAGRPAAAAASVGAPVISVRRAGALAGGATRSLPGPPAGVAAPALAAATKLIPTLPPVAADGPAPVPVAAGAAVSGAEDTLYVEPGSPAALTPRPATAAANGHTSPPPVAAPAFGTSTTSPGDGGTPPPRMQLRSGAAAPPAPGRPGAPLSGPRSGTPLSPVSPATRPSEGLSARRLVPLLIALAAAAVIVVALLVITGSGSPSNAVVHHPARTVATRGRQRQGPAVVPANVTVAVLNGTAVTNLAHDVALRIGSAGYKEGTIATAADQTHAATIVGYLPGHQRDALAVARTLGLRRSSVQPADTQATGVACAGGTGSTAGGASTASSCSADVIVTVGADLAAAASGSTTTTP